MESKDRTAFEAWCSDWITRNPEGRITATECRLGEAALAERAGELAERTVGVLLARVDKSVDGGDNSEPSPCDRVKDSACRMRPGCKMPDGSWCPAFTPPTWGSRW